MALCNELVFFFFNLQAKKLFKDYQPGVMENGGKLVVLMEIIEESLKLGEKILIFRLDQLTFK